MRLVASLTSALVKSNESFLSEEETTDNRQLEVMLHSSILLKNRMRLELKIEVSMRNHPRSKSRLHYGHIILNDNRSNYADR